MKLQENIALAPLTTLGVGGAARWFVEAQSEAEIRDALAWAEGKGCPSFVIGGGSNLVVSDAGVDGLVVRVRTRGLHTEPGDGDEILATVGAGESWNAFVRTMVESGWQGVECLAGIPGQVGATPVQNVGAYGQEVSETIVRVRAWDRVGKCVVPLAAAECRFGYRSSRFNGGDTGRYIILSVTFALRSGGAPLVKYPDLRRHFENRRGRPSLREVYDAVREIRGRKGMLIDANDPDSKSAGSFFKNPTVALKTLAALETKWTGGGQIPRFPQRDGSVKVPAAWLIENSGTRRGERFGNVKVSSKHVLALVNRGEATAADMIAAAQTIQSRVQDTWGVRLQPEPVFLGFGPDDPLPAGAIRAK